MERTATKDIVNFVSLRAFNLKRILIYVNLNHCDLRRCISMLGIICKMCVWLVLCWCVLNCCYCCQVWLLLSRIT